MAKRLLARATNILSSNTLSIKPTFCVFDNVNSNRLHTNEVRNIMNLLFNKVLVR